MYTRKRPPEVPESRPIHTADVDGTAPGRHVPVVAVKRGTHGRLIITCPWCGRRHVHGDGGAAGPSFGHRLSHCATKHRPAGRFDLGYELVADRGGET